MPSLPKPKRGFPSLRPRAGHLSPMGDEILIRPRRTRNAALGLLALVLLLPLAPAPANAPEARTIWLVRHGEYNHDDPRDAAVGKGLVPIGVAQARLLGARLQATGIAFDAFDTSPLTRARQTAEVLAEDLAGLAPRTVPEIAECTMATRRTEIVADEDPAEMKACAARLDDFFAKRFVPSPDRERNELVVCHGNVIRYLVTKALGVDTAAWLEMSVHNASLTVIRVEADGRFKVIAVGDSGHLPFGFLTGATGDPKRDLQIP